MFQRLKQTLNFSINMFTVTIAFGIVNLFNHRLLVGSKKKKQKRNQNKYGEWKLSLSRTYFFGLLYYSGM